MHWSHRNQHRYPDGQFYLDLHGYGQGQPAGPLRALWRFLLAFGTPRDELLVDVDESATQYRSLMAGQRMLVLLDNARGADQVRPLLPGPGGVPASHGTAQRTSSRLGGPGLAGRSEAVFVTRL